MMLNAIVLLIYFKVLIFHLFLYCILIVDSIIAFNIYNMLLSIVQRLVLYIRI